MLAGTGVGQEAAHNLRIAGTVINGATGAPVRQALVTLTMMPEFRGGAAATREWSLAVLTDAAGHFQFDGLDTGSYSCGAMKNGFASQAHGRITPGPSKEPLVLTLSPLAKIYGKVIDSDGEPIRGVAVRTVQSEIQDGRRITRLERSVTTDDHGEFRMWNFYPGDYYLVAAGRSGGTSMVVGPTAAGLAHEGFDPVYYPAAKGRASAGVIQLAPGQEFQTDLEIRLQPAFRVRGTLRNLVPHQPVTVELVRGTNEAGSNRVLVNGATGRFEVNDVVPGTYLLRAVQRSGASEIRGEREIQVGGANLDGVLLELLPGVTVSGVVRGGPPVLPAPVRNGRPMRAPSSHVALIPMTADEAASYSRFNADADEMGRFAIGNVPPGAYRFEVSAFGAYVASAVSGSKDLLRDGLVVAQGTAPDPIEIDLRNDGGSVSGTLEGVAGRVWVILSRGGGGEPQRAFAVEGRFQLEGVAPGDYDVFAVKDLDKLEFRNPDVLQALRGGEKVRVTAGGTATVALKGWAQ